MMHHLNFCSNEQSIPFLKFNLAVLPKTDNASIYVWRVLCSWRITPCTSGDEAELTGNHQTHHQSIQWHQKEWGIAVSASELTHNLCVCFVSHTNLWRARGEEKLTWLHLARALIRPVQILVSVPVCCELDPWQSMYPRLEQPCWGAAAAYTVLQAINVLLAPQAPGLRPVSATHWAGAGLPTPTPAQGRDGTPANLTQGWTGWTTGQGTPNQSFAPKPLQLRLRHFITDTHTHSFPFTWVLLMDLGLGSADNINGSRLTEVPLQWTVCLCVYMHTHNFFFF